MPLNLFGGNTTDTVLTLGQFDPRELPQPLDLLLDRRSQFGKYPAYLFRVFRLTRTLGEVSDSVF